MSIAEKLVIIAENEQKVYNAGYEKGKADSVITEYITASDFEIGGLESGSGANMASTNRIRTEHITCNVNQSIISIDCKSSGKWLVHFYSNGTWLARAPFASANCKNVVALCSNHDDVTHIKLVLAYTSDENVTNFDDLLSNFTIIKRTYREITEEEYNEIQAAQTEQETM